MVEKGVDLPLMEMGNHKKIMKFLNSHLAAEIFGRDRLAYHNSPRDDGEESG